MEQNGEPRNKMCVYGQLILSKAAKNTRLGKKKFSSINDVAKTGYSHAKQWICIPVLNQSQKLID